MKGTGPSRNSLQKLKKASLLIAPVYDSLGKRRAPGMTPGEADAIASHLATVVVELKAALAGFEKAEARREIWSQRAKGD
jgi:hypothetical protein